MRHAMVKAGGEALDEGTAFLCGNQRDGEHKWEIHKDREPLLLFMWGCPLMLLTKATR